MLGAARGLPPKSHRGKEASALPERRGWEGEGDRGKKEKRGGGKQSDLDDNRLSDEL